MAASVHASQQETTPNAPFRHQIHGERNGLCDCRGDRLLIGMPSNHLSPNGWLPFDVLGIVFQEYAERETIDFPLETLLLVCRSWNVAASGHCWLWNRLNIYLGHNPTSNMWAARLPLRLARCGPTIPLYIDLRNYLDIPLPKSQRTRDEVRQHRFYSPLPGADCTHTHSSLHECDCSAAARVCIQFALKVLTGEVGELCVRWWSFALNLGDYDCGHAWKVPIAKALSYPTPNLKTLIARNVHLGHVFTDILPDTGSLEHVVLVDCDLPSYPNLDAILRATVGWEDYEDSHDPECTEVLRGATRLEDLTLLVPLCKDAGLPTELPHLTHLRITGTGLPSDLYRCEMPQLSDLTLWFTTETNLSHLLHSSSFYPETLLRIAITWDLASNFSPRSEEDLQGLLSCCPHLKSIKAEGKILSVLLRILIRMEKESRQRVTRGRWLINTEDDARIRLEGDEEAHRFEVLAFEWGLQLTKITLPHFFGRHDLLYGTVEFS